MEAFHKISPDLKDECYGSIITGNNSQLRFVIICTYFQMCVCFLNSFSIKDSPIQSVSCTVHPVIPVPPKTGTQSSPTEVRLSLDCGGGAAPAVADLREDRAGLALQHQQQGAAHRKQHRGEGRAGPPRLTLQRLLVGLVGGGGALWRRHGAGRQSGAAGAHVVEVPGKLRLPGLLPQRLPNSCCVTGTASQS